QTFTFTRNPRIAADIDIAINATDALAAAEAVNVINTVLGAGTALYDAGAPNRISIPNLPAPTDAFVTGGTLYLPDVDAPSDFELESFTLFGQTFTFTDNPTRANDILAVAGDTDAVIAARVRTAIETVLGTGLLLPLDVLAPERISVPDIPTAADSFLRGGTIVVQNVADLEGYEFELNGVSFRFTDIPTQPTDILTRRTDSAVAVAAEAVRIINNTFFTTTAFQDLERIHVPDLSSTFNGVYHGSRLNFGSATPQNIEGDSFTVFGSTYTFTTSPLFPTANSRDISYTSTSTAADFANSATASINNQLAADGLAPRATSVVSGPGELIGVDFGPAGDTSPLNWNQSDGNAGTNFSLTDLTDELGNPTVVDLNVFFSPSGVGGTVANTPNLANVPAHTNSLNNIDGALTQDLSLFLQFTDLEPGGTYDLYLFGGDTTSTGSQNVTVFDAAGTSAFTQAWTNNQLVNGQASSNANLDTFAVTAVADSTGSFFIQIAETTAGDDVVIPAVAIQKTSSS
ncbi:MAG: hypothetical protein ABGZ53_15470, partial [Fuerstiella sp.]